MKKIINFFSRKKVKYNKNIILIDFLTEIANSDVGKHNPQKRIYEAKCLLEMIKSGENGR